MYCYKGWMWKVNQIIYKTPENNPYQKDIFIKIMNHIIRLFRNTLAIDRMIYQY
jgi:hypothetical protein